MHGFGQTLDATTTRFGEIRRAQELDPTSIVVQNEPGFGHSIMRTSCYDEAITELRKGVAMDPDSALFAHLSGYGGMTRGDSGPEALSEFRIVQGLTEGQDGSGGAHAYARCNKIERSLAVP